MWWMVAGLAANALMGAGSQIDAAKTKNKTAMTQLGNQINEIELQRAQTLQDTSKALFNLDVSTGQAQGQIQLQAASSGTMGASVQDAVQTVTGAANRQEANVYQQQDAKMEAYRLQTVNAVDGTHNQMDWESGSDKVFNSALSLAGGLLGQSAMSALGNIGGDTKAPVSAVAGTYDTQAGSASTGVSTASHGFDLWGSLGNVVSSWKSYLNN